MLSKKEFDILFTLNQSASTSTTQRELSKTTNNSLGFINSAIKELQKKGLVKDGAITSEGVKALEPFKVKNAIIMAAGMSSRFAPLSYEKPKGLLRVKGDILIEREIEQLKAVGIDDITVVVGYMKEKFFYLKDKYGVKIVINEDYYHYNNTSTLIRVTEELANTYICSSDNYFVDNVFEPYVYNSYYSAVYENGKTDEYCLSCNTKGKITKVTIGGEASWYMLGHVYFSKSFSDKFVKILKQEYENPITKNELWERLYMRYIKHLDLYIRKYDATKVLEFDSLDELRHFDSQYINNSDSKILKNIGSILKCEDQDIGNIEAIKTGLTNTSFSFTCKGKKYVYRHPGKGTDEYINRKSEKFSMEQAKRLGLDDTFIYMDEQEGWKISYFIEDAQLLNYHSKKEVTQALNIIRKLHKAKIKSEYDFDIWKKTHGFLDKVIASKRNETEDFDKLYKMLETTYEYAKKDNFKRCLCHCDCYNPNFLLDKNHQMYLIDWEYSGNDDPANDIGTFICCSDYTYNEAMEIIEEYLEHEPTVEELRHYLAYIAISSYYWFLWAIYQESIGKTVGEYLYIWYENSKLYAKKAIELYELN